MQNKKIKDFLSLRDDCIFCNSKLSKRFSCLPNEYNNINFNIAPNQKYIDVQIYMLGDLNSTNLSIEINSHEVIFENYQTKDYDMSNIIWSFDNLYSYFQLFCNNCDYKYAIVSDFLSITSDFHVEEIDIYSESFILDNLIIINDHKSNRTAINSFYQDIKKLSTKTNETIKINKIDFNKLSGLSRKDIREKIEMLLCYQ